MEAKSPPIEARHLITEGLRDVWHPPFAILLALSIFVFVVSASVAQQTDDVSLFLAIVLAVTSGYVQIACTLAAGAREPGRSGDAWLVAAVRRRCFWRFVLAELATVILVAAGLLFLVIGAFLVGGVVALAQPAAVLERRGPIEAVKRSAALGRDARRTLSIVFGVFVLGPAIVVQLAYQFGSGAAFDPRATIISLPAVVLTTAGTIALARAFVGLGGERVASLDRDGDV